MASRACLAALAASSVRTSAFSAGRHGVKSIAALSPSVDVFKPVAPKAPRMPNAFQLHMSSTEAAPTSTATISAPRVKTADAKISDELVSIKGWVKTVRKQKTLAFVEVNDGSNMSGIQCVLLFDDVDEATLGGESSTAFCQ